MEVRMHIPKMRNHKASAQACVVLDGRHIYLGPWGTDRAASAYDRAIAEWLANGRRVPERTQADAGRSVSEVILAYFRYCQSYYTKDGEPTSEIAIIRVALRALRHLFGDKAADDFGPSDLRALQAWVIHHRIDDGDVTVRERPVARSTANKLIARVKRCFRWACSRELVGPAVVQQLLAVEGLRRNRSEAGETMPVAPVVRAVVMATLPHLPRVVAAMAELGLHTGMRPSEICTLRTGDVDSTGEVWLYRPKGHKLEHLGQQRIVALGPRAQEVLRPFLRLDRAAYCFEPDGGKERYTSSSFRRAIHRACERAGLQPWAPNQLRHTRATEIQRQFGVEAARTVLGHASSETTSIYVERDINLAVRIAQEIG